MIAEDAEGIASRHHGHNQAQYVGDPGPAVHQIAQEDQLATVGMLPVVCIAQFRQQCVQRIDLAMHVANEVQRTGGQGRNQG